VPWPVDLPATALFTEDSVVASALHT